MSLASMSREILRLGRRGLRRLAPRLAGALGARLAARGPRPRAQPALPSGVACLGVVEGQVYLQAARHVAATGLALCARGRTLPFEPLDSRPQVDIPVRWRLPFAAEGAVGAARDAAGGAIAPERVCDARIDALAEWRLSGVPTLQLRVLRRGAPVAMDLAGTLRLAAHDRPFVFTAALAAHRCAADLLLTVTGVASGRTQTQTVAFDTQKAGGTAREGYQHVELALPPAEEETEISLSLAYKGFRDSDDGLYPYLFVAGPTVLARPPAQQAAPEGFWLWGEEIPADQTVWHRAELPPLDAATDPPVRILAGKESGTALPLGLSVALLEQRGGELTLRAGHPGRYSFYFDGAPAFTAWIGTGPSQVHIPTDYLDGATRYLSVRDPSGTVSLCHDYLLLPRVLTPQDVMQRESRAPFPGPLATQAGHRYGALKALLADPMSPEDQAQAAWALDVLEGGYDNVTLRPLRFAQVSDPDVSVIIPVHNKVEVTYSALCALLLARNTARFEVIVVDDGSTDDTARLDSIVSGIKVIRNETPRRFIGACNAGAEVARGDYLVLLNNDTEPTAGWLDALLDAFARHEGIGLAGAKLLYPDGRLQDAGGIVWETGNPWNYGNRQNPWDPRFCYARQADYLSGAALMIPRGVWDEVGGLSPYLEPMYFEDTDLAFKVREAGYTTWFVPDAVVYHHEGATSGTDTGSGFKRYQEVNRPKFQERWSAAFDGLGPEGQDPDLVKDRGIAGRVLFIDHAPPRPDRDAGSYAAIQEIRLVRSLGYKATFLPQNMANLGAYTDALQRDGVEVITAPFFTSVDEFLARRGGEFDFVYITRYHVAGDVLGMVRLHAPRARVILCNADLHFLRLLRAGLVQGDAGQIARAAEVREDELGVMRRVDLVLSYNTVEHSVIQSHTDGEARVMTCPWVVGLPETCPPRDGRAGISFLGSFRHHPNAEGVLWFAREVMPQVAERAPGLTLSIYGSGITDEITALRAPAIDPVGYVEDVDQAYDRHLIFAAPLLSGAGIKGKVLEAMAHGIPTVLSPVAAEGIGLRSGHDCLIAESPQDWVEAVLRLHGDAALWQSIADNARAYIAAQYSFETGQRLMRAAFDAAREFQPRGGMD